MTANSATPEPIGARYEVAIAKKSLFDENEIAREQLLQNSRRYAFTDPARVPGLPVDQPHPSRMIPSVSNPFLIERSVDRAEEGKPNRCAI